MAGAAIMCYDIKYNGGLHPTKNLLISVISGGNDRESKESEG